MGFMMIPGSKNVVHIKDNLYILDFTLTEGKWSKLQAYQWKHYYIRTDAA